MRCVTEPNEIRDGFDFQVSVPEKMLCRLNTHTRAKLPWSHVEVGAEEASQMAGRHADRLRNSPKGQVSHKVIAEIIQGTADDGIETGNRFMPLIHERHQMFHQMVYAVGLRQDRRNASL